MSGDGRVIVYKDRAEKYRWTDVAGNGLCIADSGQGYTDAEGAVEMAARQAHGRPIMFRDPDGIEAEVWPSRQHRIQQAEAIASHLNLHYPDDAVALEAADFVQHLAAIGG